MIRMSLDTKEVKDYLSAAQHNARNLRPFFTQCVGTAKRSVTANFRVGGRPRKWVAHSGWTKKARGKTLGGHALSQPILQASGKLYQSLGTINEIRRDTFRWGTNLKYAAIHHYGGTVRPKGHPYLTLPFPGVTGKARDYNNTFFAKGVLFQKTGNRMYKPLFLLKREVTIPSRPFMFWQDQDVKELSDWAAVFLFNPQGVKRLSSRLGG